MRIQSFLAFILIFCFKLVLAMDAPESVNLDARQLEQYNLALKLRDNKTKYDTAKAKRLFLELAGQGHPGAMHNYAMLTYKENYEEAYRWFKRAASLGLDASFNNLKSMRRRKIASYFNSSSVLYKSDARIDGELIFQELGSRDIAAPYNCYDQEEEVNKAYTLSQFYIARLKNVESSCDEMWRAINRGQSLLMGFIYLPNDEKKKIAQSILVNISAIHLNLARLIDELGHIKQRYQAVLTDAEVTRIEEELIQTLMRIWDKVEKYDLQAISKIACE